MMQDSDPLVDPLKLAEQQHQVRTVTLGQLSTEDAALQETPRQPFDQRVNGGASWGLSEPTLPETVAPAPPMPQLEGIEILGLLGQGASGVVYKARQTRLNRLVALKMIRAGASASAEELSRFRHEAEAVARLQHPNIVQIHEIGTYEGCPYVVLELVTGGSLSEQLDGTPLPARRAADLVLTLARAVQHAHERGILHRDLKPANVLLGADGVPKIADFGLAKRLDTNLGDTQTGVILGTPSYMAPEQAEGKIHALGAATDVYGLGAILYELLTGRPPFKGASLLDTLEQVRTLEPVRPTALLLHVPGELEAICLKCLKKRPEDRYPSAAALADDLQRFLAGERIRARNLTVLEKILRGVGFIAAPDTLRAGGATVLIVSPIPVLVQLVLFLACGGWPAYPLLSLIAGVSVAFVCVPTLFWPTRIVLRNAPRLYRRFAWSLLSARCVGLLLVPLLVTLSRPGDDLAEFSVVFLWWIVLDGNYFLMLGAYVGVGYPAALVHYAAAIGVALFPHYGPLVAGTLVSGGLVLLGTYLALLGPRSDNGKEQDVVSEQASHSRLEH